MEVNLLKINEYMSDLDPTDVHTQNFGIKIYVERNIGSRPKSMVGINVVLFSIHAFISTGRDYQWR